MPNQHITTPSEKDPGIIVEYGFFTAVLPETFYFVTDLEQQFIDEAMKVAEQWNARKFIHN